MSISATLLSFLIVTPQILFYVASGCFVGLFYAWGVRHHQSSNWLMCTTMISSLVVTVVTSVLFAAFFGYNMVEEMSFITETMTNIAGFTNIVIPFDITKVVMIILVMSLILSAALEGFLIHMLAFLVCTKLKVSIPAFVPLHQIYAKSWTKWIVAIGLIVCSIVFFTQDSQWLEIILPFFLLIILVVIFYGYIYVMVILIPWKASARLLTILLLFIIFPIGLPILFIAGINDIYFCRRKQILKGY